MVAEVVPLAAEAVQRCWRPEAPRRQVVLGADSPMDVARQGPGGPSTWMGPVRPDRCRDFRSRRSGSQLEVPRRLHWVWQQGPQRVRLIGVARMPAGRPMRSREFLQRAISDLGGFESGVGPPRERPRAHTCCRTGRHALDDPDRRAEGRHGAADLERGGTRSVARSAAAWSADGDHHRHVPG